MRVSCVCFFLCGIAVFGVFGCSKKTDEITKIISSRQVFTSDPSISNLEVIIPEEKNSNEWISREDVINNKRLQNITFSDKINSRKSVNIGYKPSFNYQNTVNPIVKDGILYIMDGVGNLSARNLQNPSKIIWKKRVIKREFLKYFFNASLGFYEGKLFVVSGFSKLFVINSKDGSVIYEKDFKANIVGKPAFDSERNELIVMSNANRIYGIDVENGSIKWSFDDIERNTDIIGTASILVGPNSIFVGFSSGNLYSIDKETHNIIFETDMKNSDNFSSDFAFDDIDSNLILDQKNLYVVNNSGSIKALDFMNGDEIWNLKISSVSDFWLAGNMLYIIDNMNQILAIHIYDGKIKWINADIPKNRRNLLRKNIRNIYYNGITMVGGNLLVTSSDKKLFLVNPKNGHIIQKRRVKQKITDNPMVVDGRIYLYTIGKYDVNLEVFR